MAKDPISYSSTGVNYEAMDPVKRLAQELAKGTSKNLEKFDFKEVSQSRGDSAYVWDEGDSYKAFVMEGLGTKSLVADEVRKITSKTHYGAIAQDTVAAIVNDVIVVGAKPMVINAYWGLGSSSWLEDAKRTKDLVEGWAKACDLAGASWGGGETPTVKGIINPDTIDLGGSCVGIIKPKSRLTLGDKLQEGDRILLIESSGIHANGLTLARTLADNLAEGYATKLEDGSTYGESLLTPTYIYVQVIQDLFESGIDIHYMVNITGHGFRKLMRAKQDFVYIVDELPEAQPVFKFIQYHSGNSDDEMYGNFNMGAGFAIYIPEQDLEKAQKIISKHNLKSWNSGHIEKGEKQVIIEPKNLIYRADTLGVR